MSDAIPAGWPCATLPADPPSVADRLSNPSADDLLPQVLQLTPRGAAWGTDEAGDGQGASPVMLQVWRAVAGHAAQNYATDWDLATQALPSAISWSLPDWETEYGLPDTCDSGGAGVAQRIAAVRARFGALGGQSPAYFTCLAAALGYEVTIEEPTQFLVDTSELVGDGLVETWFYVDDGGIVELYGTCDDLACDDTELEAYAIAPAAGDGGSLDSVDLEEDFGTCDDLACDDVGLEAFVLAPSADGDALQGFVLDPGTDDADQVAGGLLEGFGTCDDLACDDTELESFDFDPNGSVWKFWVVHVTSLGDSWFEVDTGELDYDPLEGFLPAGDLECVLRRLSPPHTELIFDYSATA